MQATFLQAAQYPVPPRDAMLGALSEVCRGAFDRPEVRGRSSRPLSSISSNGQIHAASWASS